MHVTTVVQSLKCQLSFFCFPFPLRPYFLHRYFCCTAKIYQTINILLITFAFRVSCLTLLSTAISSIKRFHSPSTLHTCGLACSERYILYKKNLQQTFTWHSPFSVPPSTSHFSATHSLAMVSTLAFISFNKYFIFFAENLQTLT